MSTESKLKIKLFLDGADKKGMLSLKDNALVQGFTTNPSLMQKAGVKDYQQFALELLGQIKDKPISFEVFADEFDVMEAQAHQLASWGKNVVVKIPVMNTKSEFSGPIIRKLSAAGVVLNVTAIFTSQQVKAVAECLSPNTPSIVSVFAGRIADAGVDPMPIMQESLEILKKLPKAELLWASTRELFNIVQADKLGCHIITVPNDILSKLNLIGKSLDEYSLDTVKAFYQDALTAGFHIHTAELT